MSYDAKGVVRYLIDLRVKDPLMFVAHTVGADVMLQNLFWSDGCDTVARTETVLGMLVCVCVRKMSR